MNTLQSVYLFQGKASSFGGLPPTPFSMGTSHKTAGVLPACTQVRAASFGLRLELRETLNMSVWFTCVVCTDALVQHRVHQLLFACHVHVKMPPFEAVECEHRHSCQCHLMAYTV